MTQNSITPTFSALLNGGRMPAPATYRLYLAGACLADVARRLEVTPMAVSHYLGGRRTSPPGLRRAIVDVVGAEAADAVIALIPERIAA
jgi:hypothetical protein